jgi:NAD(P)-dependent dehydrogenase (short-subunit alcohol dehydrogenase family)
VFRAEKRRPDCNAYSADNEAGIPVGPGRECGRRHVTVCGHTQGLRGLSEIGCQAAVNQILFEQRRLDVVVNNAGMLMTGLTEAFSVKQVAHIIDTNALSWLRVNRAALPAMRRQGYGLLMYVGSTTARLHEPFLGPYIASKVAGDAIAEIMGMEVRPSGIESVTLVPGAFTSGTEHFAHSHAPEYLAIEQQYGGLPDRIASLGDRLNAIDAANGGALDVSAVGQAAVDVLAMAGVPLA